jgi:uncharacterized phage infection (PIP) family protein YhgE
VDNQRSEADRMVVELESKLMLVEEERSQARDQAENLRKELMGMREELQKKVNQMTQVTNMKKMIQDKNSKIKTLRDRLGKYENIEDDE